MIESLKTYTEQIGEDIPDRIKSLIAQAKQIVFLGFGYTSENLKLLSPKDTKYAASNKSIYGTMRYIDQDNKPAITNKIHSMFERTPLPFQVELRDCDASELLRRFQFALRS